MIKFRRHACREALPIILGVILLSAGIVWVNGQTADHVRSWQVNDYQLTVIGVYDED